MRVKPLTAGLESNNGDIGENDSADQRLYHYSVY